MNQQPKHREQEEYAWRRAQAKRSVSGNWRFDSYWRARRREVRSHRAHRRGYPRANYILLVIATVVITLFALLWLGLLVVSLFEHSFVESTPTLLLSAVALWVTNVLVLGS